MAASVGRRWARPPDRLVVAPAAERVRLIRMSLRCLIVERIRSSGPITVADYMRMALYEPGLGYYAARTVRSGREGDFYTSVDVGPLFGELLSVQLRQMWQLLGSPDRMTLVEAGAGNGRLARDVLQAIVATDPAFYDAIDLALVETSGPARAEQISTLGAHAERLSFSGDTMPPRWTGVLLCNELFDALPTHAVLMTTDGLREILVGVGGPNDDELVEVVASPTTPALAAYLGAVGVQLEPGWRAEVNLEAIDWMQTNARAMARGFVIAIDYGHLAHELYGAAHAAGTLTSYRLHQGEAASERPRRAAWLTDPGDRDLTSHADFSSIRAAAEAEGLTTLGLLDQTYFLLGLGLAERVARETGDARQDLKRRMAAKTLMLPGGLGSSHKVLLLGKDVGTPTLLGCSQGGRLT